MKKAVIFISLLSLCLYGCNKDQHVTIYGKWLRTWTTQYNSTGDLIWGEESQRYPFILEFKGNKTCYIHEDTGPDPQGSFHLDIRKMALIFEATPRILPVGWDYEIQIVEITSDFLWLKNKYGYEAKFKRYYL